MGHGERGGDSATAWAIRDVPGGVFAIEVSGYGDPPSATLTSLAAEGGAAAVVRNNVQARMRFGCAKDGHVVFDADDYMYEDPSRVPVSLRPLFDLVHDDLTGETDDDAPDEFAVGLAMSEVITGIRLSADDVAAIQESRFFMVEAAGH
nr:DUF6461 domain-containing protein [Nocardioides lijunqiniae]